MGKRDTKGGLAGYYDSDVGFLSEPDMQDIWVPKYRYGVGKHYRPVGKHY